jgi:hypothetical protein
LPTTPASVWLGSPAGVWRAASGTCATHRRHPYPRTAP